MISMNQISNKDPDFLKKVLQYNRQRIYELNENIRRLKEQNALIMSFMDAQEEEKGSQG